MSSVIRHSKDAIFSLFADTVVFFFLVVNKGVDSVGLVHGGDWALSVSLTGSAACFL